MGPRYCLFGTTVLLFVISIAIINGEVRFTNIKCYELDPDFCNIDYCFLKSMNRTYQYISLKVLLHKVPITNVTVRWTVLKKGNGYRPFLYNITVDACQFLKTRNNKLIDFAYEFFRDYSNMNHTCPYDHDLIIESLPPSNFNKMLQNIIPFPLGEYLLDTTWSAYNVERARVQVYTNWT